MSEGRRLCSDERNICYELFRESVTRNDAELMCHQRSGTLAAILDDKAQNYISNLTSVEGNFHYWIGGKLKVMDQWRWVDGSLYPGQCFTTLPVLARVSPRLICSRIFIIFL